MLTLDVIIPTYNRRDQLVGTLDSLIAAKLPEGLAVSVTVVDNNCGDGTAQLVREMAARYPLPLHVVIETRQGLSNARNGGIAATTGELIGFIDDDERIDMGWFEAIAREFGDPKIEFIGGPCAPLWLAPLPAWLPSGYECVVGIVPPGPNAVFNADFPGMLMGGNAVLRRSVFQKVGVYATELGRTNEGLLSMEDLDFYQRLLRNGITGCHVPDLIIHHMVPPTKLTRRYFRRWHLGHAISEAVYDGLHPNHVACMAGVPRWMFRETATSLLAVPWHLCKGDISRAFECELQFWKLLGYYRGHRMIAAGALRDQRKKSYA